MRTFRVEPIAQTEFDEGAAWYESQEPGLGFEFNTEIDRVLARIAHQETFWVRLFRSTARRAEFRSLDELQVWPRGWERVGDLAVGVA